ncbi:NYN domain-containing protein [uncultured Roseovarius sp.]|uniref:NYN domain-containing protein n=1 Tax=uncultured Roseovarius sp. TaxID=293344 RepID=UPI002607000D|nr:NYN domain-containing protein [uncultured Roseovarius sp.]
MSTLPPIRLTVPLRLSVFVDADNISVTHAQTILDLARRHGAPDLLRAYGNVGLLPDWDKVPGFQFIHSGSGKNATDMLMCIDAMERTLSEQCEAVLLVSSDQDFTHLATRLRGYGLTVIGAGEAKTLERFRAACSEFHVITSAPPCSAKIPQPKAEIAKPIVGDLVSDLDQKIRNVIRSNCKDANGLEVTMLSARMFKDHGVKISKRSEKNWRGYLAKRPDLYTLDPKGPNAKVRYRPEAFRNAPA